jgi:hypothetical protein
MKFRKVIKTTDKLNKLKISVLESPNPKDYLWGVVLTAVGESVEIPVEEKQTYYENTCDKIESTIKRLNDGEFILDDTTVSIAFVIMEKHIQYGQISSGLATDEIKTSQRRSRSLFPLGK